MKVPWMSKTYIARKATTLLEDFQERAGYEIRPPIPVEEIVERSLGLTLRYVDLEKILGSPDVLGAVYAEAKLVCIHERLFEHSSEGRLVFTCAHEAGHWVLHVPLWKQETSTQKTILCRAGDVQRPLEWQADYFASCLLMPEREVREAFEAVCCPQPIVIQHAKRLATNARPCQEPYLEQWPYIAAAMCEAGGFSNVSRQAMIFRLQDLGLVVNRTGIRMDWRSLYCEGQGRN